MWAIVFVKYLGRIPPDKPDCITLFESAEGTVQCSRKVRSTTIHTVCICYNVVVNKNKALF